MDFLHGLGLAALLIGLAVLGLGRIYQPWVGQLPGPALRTVPISPRGRARLHAGWAVPAAAITVAGDLTGWLPTWFGLALLAWLLVLLTLPVRYTITARGIQLGRTAPRRWTEFCGLWVSPGRIYLQPVAGARGLDVWSGDPALPEQVRALLRGSYRGRPLPPRAELRTA